MYGLNTIPPSRFSDHNANGLWEYSPFLCGSGLMEGLELSYRLSMMLWEQMPEPILLIHLHHAAVEKGYLTRPIGLYQSIEDLMKESFFVKGQPPTSNFGEALLAKIGETGSRSQAQRRSLRQKMGSPSNLHQVLDLSQNTFYKKPSSLALYRKADWNADAVPDNDITPGSFLFLQRIGRTKKIIDPETKKVRLEETPLIRNARAAGMDDKMLMEMVDLKAKATQAEPTLPQSVLDAMTPEGFKTMSTPEGGFQTFPSGTPSSIARPAAKSDNEFYGKDLLDLIKMDVANDVQGIMPLSSLNYLSVTVWFIIMFNKIEERLREARDPVYIEAFERPGPWERVKRVGLGMLALRPEHDKSLRLIAEVLESGRCGFMDYIYWEDLDTEPKLRQQQRSASGYEGGNECTVM
ncbi:hypothetical protein FALBO_17303 [Fusarium albosuccineum]|uniref:Uncharacterized protein n=1 Tax=Fusarium albosuccineum TaxID=1237068 RepID=A0A8H4NR49_9HYPO|nr:hypothetical protein FALBO_17303 [Fusarium albosuccineum]